MQLGGAALDLEPAGQDAFVAQAVVDALAHGRPQLEQATAHLGLRAPGQFVGHHQFADAQLVLFAQRQKLGGTVEVVGQLDLLAAVAASADLRSLDNKTTTDRIVGLLQQ
ncbi:hypothetical protein D3C78_1532910 [compost metagenome]